MTAQGVVPLAEIVRSGFTEGWHDGRLVALAADGSVEFAYGDVEAVMMPRSSNKPMQAVAMLENGLDLTGELLALAAASHAGEPFHLEGVRKILAGAGLDEQALACPADWPLAEQAKLAMVRAGGDRQRVTMNCSGKHAAMLATCVVNHWPITDYLAPDHPMQRASRAAVERLSGEPVRHDAVDGCGAPLYGISLVGLARAFRACVLAAPATPERRVADAMRAHPEYVSGTDRIDTDLMAGVPGLLAKGGAEGVQAVALPDGRAIAVKVGDGDHERRAVGPVLVAALRRLGVEAPVLSRYAESPLLGGGHPVGAVRSVI
ncbi:L-asparaginase II [Catenulispora acidiphila DSM 44928]|uniref:L-asparaginase II n=1 Tax=Catenulispora acidiphila (strain DSM 44928 / JCM 14897 / NBRC 102108 / NRRL B-24433 / ID139908) TaxID=479433 RepID=C7QKG2_CATAD|nr:asparaginase [Catenulispora acidiphila]ACU77061.1 L-asparaginase II [Catenulispora acidiphila DSM 44928]